MLVIVIDNGSKTSKSGVVKILLRKKLEGFETLKEQCTMYSAMKDIARVCNYWYEILPLQEA